MPIRKFNFTKRKRIKLKHIRIIVSANNSAHWFGAKIEIEKYDLPKDGLVFVETYRHTRRMRFDYGTVGNLMEPDQGDRLLKEFPLEKEISFRVKVIDIKTNRILAESKGISTSIPAKSKDVDIKSRQKSLLGVEKGELGFQCWRVSFENDFPILQINEKVIPNWRTAVTLPFFKILVLPTVLREILNRILYVENCDDLDGEDWMSSWLRLAQNIPGVGKPPNLNGDDMDKGKIDDWIDEAVACFCKKYIHSLELIKDS